MKISLGFNLQSGAFGGGNQFGRVLAAYLQKQGVEVSFDLKDPQLDLILLGEPDRQLKISAYDHHDILHYLRCVNPRAVVVQRMNNTSEARDDADKHFNKFRLHANQVADFTVFVSEWVHQKYVEAGYQGTNYRIILNGGDQTLWKPLSMYGEGLGVRSGVYKIVTHHWSTHPNKGHDIYLRLDKLLDDPTWAKRISFTFIGRLPEGINFKNARVLAPLSGQALADELRQHDVYLTASRHEAGPNHCIEGALCGLPLLYIESGALPEYGRGYGVGFTPENFEAQLETMLHTYDTWAAKMEAYPFTDERMCRAYWELFQELIAKREVKQRLWLKKVAVNETTAIDWLRGLPTSILPYVNSLNQTVGFSPLPPGRFLPTKEGLTQEGETVALPFSCLALKVYVMLNAWEDSPEWVSFIKSFQVEGNPLKTRWGENAFIDPALVQPVLWQTRRWQHWKERYLTPQTFTKLQRMMSAETKQAIASLMEVGARYTPPFAPYQGFPQTPRQLNSYLKNLDWSKPWASGAHLATLAVFYRTEAPHFMPPTQAETLLALCQQFTQTLVHGATGAYFLGNTPPPYDELINGAMKVLTALDWLEIPIHAPEKLIDSTLAQMPRAEGCHLVDAVYVLYRCAQQTDYRKTDIQAYCLHLVATLVEHFNPLDGGFSYHMGRSQTHFYGVQISWGYPISDLHGTTLLTWAAAMILHLLGAGAGWRIIKP